jgi:hypothetical protein
VPAAIDVEKDVDVRGGAAEGRGVKQLPSASSDMRTGVFSSVSGT